jgi:hypothetical protein
MAMDIESSIVIRRASRFSNASLKIGQPPITRPTTPITPESEPHSGSRQRDRDDAHALDPLELVLVLVLRVRVDVVVSTLVLVVKGMSGRHCSSLHRLIGELRGQRN